MRRNAIVTFLTQGKTADFISRALSCSVEEVEQVRSEESTTSVSTQVNDVVESPRAVLEEKLRRIDKAFDIAWSEFKINPGQENAMNMNSFLTQMKQTLKEIHEIRDMSLMTEEIVTLVLIPYTKAMMEACLDSFTAFAEVIETYMPENAKPILGEMTKTSLSSLARDVQPLYADYINSLGRIMEVSIDKYIDPSQQTQAKNGKPKKAISKGR